MWIQFILQNLHFAIGVFASLTLFSVFWLYWDAWVDRKNFKEGVKIFGYLVLSLSFLLNATSYENEIFKLVVLGSKNLGYLLILIGLLLEPLGIKPGGVKASLAVLIPALTISTPFVTSAIAWLYLRKATLGLENHLKKVALAFFALSIYEFLNLSALFTTSTNIDIFKLVSPFGPIWIAEHIILSIAASILISWAFYYLLKRINTQLFIIFTTTIMSIFILTSTTFTFLLLKNLVDETLGRLSTDASVLSFGIDAKKSEAMAISQSISGNSILPELILTNDRKTLADLAEAA